MNKKNKGIKKNKILNWILVVLSIALDTIFCLLSFSIVDYSNISSKIFTLVYIGMIVLVIIVNTFTIISIYKRKTFIKIICGTLTLILTIVSCYGYVTVNKIVKSINNIVNSENTFKESLSVSFVTYNNNLITSENDLEGCKFGIVGNESFQEGNLLAKKELDAKKISVSFVEYDSYNNLLLGLFAGECDVASLPSNYYDIFSDEDGYEEYLEKTKAIYTFDEVITVNNNNSNIDVVNEPFTILVTGIDEGRTDSIILMTVNPKTMTLTMTSIARDTYVPIACYSGNARDKINHARTISRQCTMDTISEWLDIDIDFYIETNFKGVVDIVNAIGGLVLNSPVSFVGQNSSSERGHYVVYVPEGEHYLNGEQVLAFARERHQMPNGDYDRQVHQQQVIEALIKSILNIRDINTLLGVLEAAGDNISTNMSVNQMTSLANYIFKVVDSVPVDQNAVINIKNSRITGYSSYYYNYGMALPLWIMLPYDGAVEDAKKLINGNLVRPENKELVIPKNFNASVIYYDEPTYYQETYDEPREIIDMPDFMPMMKYKYNVSQARAWANERKIPLTVISSTPNDEYYVEGYAEGMVVGQSVPYATLTENIASLTIWVIGEAGIPSYVGNNYTQLISWCNDNGYSYDISWISSNDAAYDASKAGLVVSQESYDASNYVKAIVYDYPAVTINFPGVGATKAQIDQWAATTGVYVQYNGTSGNVRKYSVINYTGDTASNVIKTNSTVVVSLTDSASYTVTFVSGIDNSTISLQTVYEGEDAELPIAPNINGYSFIGWSGTYTNIRSDQTVVATYSELANYTITFIYGLNQEKRNEQIIQEGGSAVVPADAEIEGYSLSWSSSYSNISSGMTIIANYTAY